MPLPEIVLPPQSFRVLVSPSRVPNHSVLPAVAAMRYFHKLRIKILSIFKIKSIGIVSNKLD